MAAALFGAQGSWLVLIDWCENVCQLIEGGIEVVGGEVWAVVLWLPRGAPAGNRIF